jgi:rod shape-determining protein MreD
MKPWLSFALIVGLVPLQTTVLRFASIGGVRPDLCLVVTCLTALLVGETEGALLGLTLGALQDLLSPGEAWLNMMTKGTIGLLVGIAGRHLASTTPTAVFVLVLALSATSGMAFLFIGWPGLEASELFTAIRVILIPQAFYDALIATGLFWLASRYRIGGDDGLMRRVMRLGN